MELIATKSLRYGTRHLQAGETFEAAKRDAKILIAVHKARDPNHRKPGILPPPPASLAEQIAPVETRPEPAIASAEPVPEPHTVHEAPHHDPAHELRDTLRARAEALGVDVDRRWGVDRLSEEIEAGISRAGEVKHDDR